MNWYYAEAGQQVGPIPEEELLRLVESGKIRPDTLVWHEGLPNWQVYDYVKPATSAPAAPPPVLPGEPPVALGGNEAVCVQCGRIVLQENAIAYGGNWICANCKPVYFQKLKEGAPLPFLATAMPYAGFWIRFAAKFIDWLVLGLTIGIPLCILFVLYFAPRATRGPGAFNFNMGIAWQLLINLGSTTLVLLYNWFFLAKYGATPGKMACGLKVVTAAGAPIGSGQALGRSAGEILSQLVCYIGYIIAGFDAEKRALHDHMANTRVIKK